MKAKILPFLCILFLGLPVSAIDAPPRLPVQVLRALETPSEATLYSLHPDPRAPYWFASRFRGYRVLGRLPLKNEIHRLQVARAVAQAAQTYQGNFKCVFSPRHGLRVQSRGKTYDFLICYECSQMEVYAEEREIAELSIGGSPDLMNSMLRAAHVRIAK